MGEERFALQDLFNLSFTRILGDRSQSDVGPKGRPTLPTLAAETLQLLGIIPRFAPEEDLLRKNRFAGPLPIANAEETTLEIPPPYNIFSS
jgi:hypothetical protein